MISIIIPLYNKQDSFVRTIESVLSQTFTQWELIIVNDGSTDSSGELAREIAKKDQRIHLIEQANAGVSVARNNGVAAAKNDFIAFLDADDCWCPDHLECLASLVKLYPEYSWFSTLARTVCSDEGRNKLLYENKAMKINDIKAVSAVVDFFQHTLCGHENKIHISSVMIRRDAINKAGGFPAGVAVHEDGDFFFRLAMKEDVVLLQKSKVMRNLDTEERASIRMPMYPLAPFCVDFWDQLSVDFHRNSKFYWAKQYVICKILEYAKTQRIGGNLYETRRCLRQCRNQVTIDCTKKMHRQTIAYFILPVFLIKWLQFFLKMVGSSKVRKQTF